MFGSIKKLNVLVLVAVIAIFLVPGMVCAEGQSEGGSQDGEKESYELKLAQLFAPDSDLGKSARKFAEIVNEESNGRITINVFDTGQLGGQKEVYSMLKRGSLDFNIDWPMTSFNSKLAVVFAPYMFTSWEDAKSAYATPDGWLTQLVQKAFEESNIRYLGPYPYEFSGVTLNERPATTKEQASGLKIRTPPIKPFASTWNTLGFTPTPIDYSETPTAIQTGVVDGQAGGGPEQAWSDFRDVSNYYVHYKDYFSCAQFMMSMKTWNEMPEGDRKIIVDAAKQIINERFDAAQQREQHYFEELKKAGVEVVHLTDEEMQQAKKRVREEVWPGTLKKLIGEEFLSVIKENAQ